MICGEVFLTGQSPSHCPFCGAHGEHFVRVDDPSKGPAESAFTAEGELTDLEKKNLQASISTELLNTTFYSTMASKGDRSTTEGIVLSRTYKRLSRIEDEHAGVFCKLLGVEKKKQKVDEEVLKANVVTGVWKDDVSASVLREQRAHDLYVTFAKETDKPRLKLVWNALADVEADHIALEDHQKKLFDARS